MSTTIYIRSTGNDSNDGLTVGNALLTAQAAFNMAWAGYAADNTQSYTLDFGAGSFGGVTLSDQWPSAISVKGAGSGVSNLGGVVAFDAGGAISPVAISSDRSINLGGISGGTGGEWEGASVTLTNCVAGDITVNPYNNLSVTLNGSVVGNIFHQSGSCNSNSVVTLNFSRAVSISLLGYCNGGSVALNEYSVIGGLNLAGWDLSMGISSYNPYSAWGYLSIDGVPANGVYYGTHYLGGWGLGTDCAGALVVSPVTDTIGSACAASSLDCNGYCCGSARTDCAGTCTYGTDNAGHPCDYTNLDALGFCCGDATTDCAGNFYSPSNENGDAALGCASQSQDAFAICCGCEPVALDDCAGQLYSPCGEAMGVYTDPLGNSCNPNNSVDAAGYCCGGSFYDCGGNLVSPPLDLPSVTDPEGHVCSPASLDELGRCCGYAHALNYPSPSQVAAGVDFGYQNAETGTLVATGSPRPSVNIAALIGLPPFIQF